MAAVARSFRTALLSHADRRRTCLHAGRVLLALLAAVAIGIRPALAQGGEDERPPNVLWIIADDMSAHIGAWGYNYAQTPNLDRLAEEGIRYTNAYATNPVCSPSRSALITGIYSTTTGTHNLRSTAPVPERITGFPAYLQEIGYFTANRGKTDYNSTDAGRLIEESWSEASEDAHWRDRPDGAPFFTVFNPRVTHQSRISFLDQEFDALKPHLGTHDPELAPLPPYYPDTPVVRQTWARYHDAVTAFDDRVGELLDQLEADGLADSTVVFVYSDHGFGLPRGKRMLTDSGLGVPLIVRIPEAYDHLRPAQPGEATNELVSFIDFPPTVLRLAGAEVPDYMQGRAFLGEGAPGPRQYVYGARDRVDEAIEKSRSVRTKRYLYVRNFFPHISWAAPEFYSDRAPIRQNMLALSEKGRLSEEQYTYTGPSKPDEALFDVKADPHQLHNLAHSPTHQDVLERMRARLHGWMRETRDLGLLPEETMMRWSREGADPLDFGSDSDRYPIDRILEVAALVGDPANVSRQADLLDAEHPAVRFWAAAGLRAAVPASHHARTELRAALEDEVAPVRIEAAGTLLALGPPSEHASEYGDVSNGSDAANAQTAARRVLAEGIRSERELVALRAARTLQLLGEDAAEARPEMVAVRDSLGAINEEQGSWPSQTAWYIYESLDATLR